MDRAYRRLHRPPTVRRRAVNRLDAVVLLVTRDHDLVQRMAKAACASSVTIDHLNRLPEATGPLDRPGVGRVLAVDLSGWLKHEVEALRTFMSASPDWPILVVGDDDDPAMQATLLADGVQDVLSKLTLSASLLRRAAQNALARKAREIALSNETKRARATVAAIAGAVLSTDAGWRVTFLNPVAEMLTGWNCADAIGRHVSDILPVFDATTRIAALPEIKTAAGAGRPITWPSELVLVRRNAQELPIEASSAPIHDNHGRFAGMVMVFHDLAGSRDRARSSPRVAEYDRLTALPEHALFTDRLERSIALSRRHDRKMAILHVNLDHFVHVDDSLAQPIADEILRTAAQRIVACVRQSDSVSRHRGDAFFVLLSEVHDEKDAAITAENIRLAVQEPYIVDGHHRHLTASIGISVYPSDGETAFVLAAHAETAGNHAQKKGGNNSQFFREEINVRAREHKMMTGDLRHALMRSEFYLVFQPKISLLSGNISGFEALARWRHPARGVLYPASFIPVAEECGLIIPIGEWVLLEACTWARLWLDAGLRFETMAVNISAVEFRSDSLFDRICRILRTTGLEPRFLELELTETAVMRDFEATSVVLRALSAIGVQVAADDFGTGYTNLSYLKRFPINTLKLDRSFIHELPGSADVGIIVSSVIRMAHGLRLKVVGEGVETLQQLEFLKAHDCEEAQGFYFSKPLEPGECQSLLMQVKPHWTGPLASLSLTAS